MLSSALLFGQLLGNRNAAGASILVADAPKRTRYTDCVLLVGLLNLAAMDGMVAAASLHTLCLTPLPPLPAVHGAGDGGEQLPLSSTPVHSSCCFPSPAVCVVVLVTAVNNYQKEQQFRMLQAVSSDVKVSAALPNRPTVFVFHAWSSLLAGGLLPLPAAACSLSAVQKPALCRSSSPLHPACRRPPCRTVLLFLNGCVACCCLNNPYCRQVRAIRNGREVELPVRDVLVGDLLLVETGDILCTDGLLVAGCDVK